MALIIANAWFTGWTLAEMLLTDSTADWAILVRAGQLAGDPRLYDYHAISTFVWSPLAAYPLAVITQIGLGAFRALHILAAIALPGWTLRILVLLSWPFWLDFSTGNLTVFIFLAGVWALRGSDLATTLFFILALLIPRPLVIPAVVWILWRRPEWRLPFAGLFAANAILLFGSGLAPTWVVTVLSVSSELQGFLFNVSPTRWLGYWWLILSLPLAAWLLIRGRVGLAGLAASPYIWPYYLLFALLAFDRANWSEALAVRSHEQAGTRINSPTALRR